MEVISPLALLIEIPNTQGPQPRGFGDKPDRRRRRQNLAVAWILGRPLTGWGTYGWPS